MFPHGRAPAAWVVAIAALLSVGPAGAAAPGGAAGDDRGLPVFLAPLRADVLAAQGKATFRSSECDAGSPEEVFDGRIGTVLRTRSVNPAYVEVSFDTPREVLSVEVLFAGDETVEWSLLAGDHPDRMGILVERHRVPGDRWSPVESLGRGKTARVWRVVAKKMGGDDCVRFAEVALQARQVPESLEMLAPSDVVCPDGSLVLRARVHYDGGFRSSTALGLGFLAPRDAPFRLEPGAERETKSVTVRYEGSGTSTVIARIKGKGFWLESPPLEIEARSEGKPDWSVGWIERTPRKDFDAADGGLPAPGEAVTYVAHVKNYGTCNAGRVPYLWQVDGKNAGDGFLSGLERFAEGTASMRLASDGARHDVRFVVNPGGIQPETSTANNEVVIQTDALRLGLWVEQPVLDHFHRVQASFKDGANGWEDWVQRNLRRWNRMLADARGPLCPEGVTERLALDLVVPADEGALPIHGGHPANDPDAADRTVDVQRGFPASLLDGDLYRRAGARRDDNPLWFDADLLRHLGRARYLVDLRWLDVHPEEVRVGGIDPEDATHVTKAGLVTTGEAHQGISAHEASALQRIAGRRARGSNRFPPPSQGEYLADLPRTCGLRVLAEDGKPLDGVTVRAWRRSRDRDGRTGFGGSPVRETVTVDGGFADLMFSGADPFFEGRKEGPLDPAQGILLVEFLRGGKSRWAFVECVPFNLAFWGGEIRTHLENVTVDLPR